MKKNHYKIIADAIKNNDNLWGEAKFDLILDLTEGFILDNEEFNPIKFMIGCYEENLIDKKTEKKLIENLPN